MERHRLKFYIGNMVLVKNTLSFLLIIPLGKVKQNNIGKKGFKMNLKKLQQQIQLSLGNHPLSEVDYKRVESELDIKLPETFKELNAVCSYEYCKFVSFFNFGSNLTESVIAATLGVRDRFANSDNNIVLYLDEAGIILLDATSIEGTVIWCSIYDLENYFSKEKMQYEYKIFPTFSDFFQFLLDEEEKSREEDMK
jgi:hypothetical protein